MTYSEDKYLFANPHCHHSYFTVLALSQLHPVLCLCPPLQLQIIRGQWKTAGLKLQTSNFYERFYQHATLLSFFLFKLRAISELQYLSIFSWATNSLLLTMDGAVFVHYQDYIKLLPKTRASVKLDVCELIINAHDTAENRLSTVVAVTEADVVICPTSSIALSLPIDKSKLYITSYGGDKALFRAQEPVSLSTPSSRDYASRRTIVVSARANSFRKGIDIMLSALLQLSERLSAKGTIMFKIQICGSVSEGKAFRLYEEVKKKLHRQQTIELSAQQFTTNDYLKVVKNSDIFLMPSRLEGSSPAALEALWLGTPCILSQACGIEKFQQNRHGLLLSPLSSQPLCDALYELVLDPSLMKNWRRCLLRDSHLFTWAGYLESYKMALNATDQFS